MDLEISYCVVTVLLKTKLIFYQVQFYNLNILHKWNYEYLAYGSFL